MFFISRINNLIRNVRSAAGVALCGATSDAYLQRNQRSRINGAGLTCRWDRCAEAGRRVGHTSLRVDWRMRGRQTMLRCQ